MSGSQPYRQKEALNFIRAQVEAHGIPPTLAEIAGFLGSRKSKASAMRIVNALVAEGHLRRLHNRWRAIELVETKDHHACDCACGACADRRYLAQLKLVEGLYRTAEISSGVIATNFRPASVAKRAALLGIPHTAVSRKRPAFPAGAQ